MLSIANLDERKNWITVVNASVSSADMLTMLKWQEFE